MILKIKFGEREDQKVMTFSGLITNIAYIDTKVDYENKVAEAVKKIKKDQ